MLDKMDHWANKAIPITARMDPMKNASSDWSTPHTMRIKVEKNKEKDKIDPFLHKFPSSFDHKFFPYRPVNGFVGEYSQ